ncbi:MAG TPA: hypothetical protein VGX03_36800, partial [Candidatus Binatia bacterium]|nr:hypothetical protein [Candidatus Binatia bacterium]
MTLIICLAAYLLHDAISLSTLCLSIAIAIGYWLGYAVNDYCDAPFDAYDTAKGARNLFVTHP